MQERGGLGLAGQRTAVEKFVAKWRVTLCAEYNEAESGRNCDRPNLHRALAACRVFRATLVIAQIDRLACDVAFIAMLIESGIEFVAADFPLANSFYKHVMAAIAEHELKSMSDRRRAVCAVLKSRGIDIARHLRGKQRPNLLALDKAQAVLLARDAKRAIALGPCYVSCAIAVYASTR
jgi:DNA invertase Pin-like site-specific DNA recombinase